MKLLAALLASALFLSACATGKNYATRAELQNAPGSTVELIFQKPIKDVYPALRDMTASCFESKQIRTSGDRPDATGKNGNITIMTAPAILQARILVTAKVESTESGDTRVTIYYSGEDAPKGLVERYRRWIDTGSTSCTTSQS